jgi:hypothetical protein
MQRRLFLLASVAARLRADAAQQVFDLFTSMATALGASEPSPFLDAFDRGMPEYQKLAGYIEAITSQSDLVCSIDVRSNEGSEEERTVELDWLLQLTAPQMPVVRRREKIKCRLRRQGKKWKITSLTPLDFFRPVAPK